MVKTVRNNKKKAIHFLQRYLLDTKDPKYCHDEEERKRASYTRSAVLYLISKIMDDPYDSPITVVETFIAMTGRTSGLMASVAHDTALDILDTYYLSGTRKNISLL